jgi:hypothetical protein
LTKTVGPRLPVILVVAHDYPPFTGDRSSPAARWVETLTRDGCAVEVIAPSDTDEEFTHLDGAGNLVHRIVPGRSYAFGVLAKLAPALSGRLDSRRLRLAVRAAEKILERTQLWNRKILWGESLLGEVALVAPEAAAATWQLLGLGVPAAVRRQLEPQPVRAIDLVICTYDRLEELIVSIDSALVEVEAARQLGIDARLRVMHQNADLPRRLAEARPDLVENVGLSLEPSSPPSLTRARNAALASSQADLVVFIDDDVRLEPGFLAAYVDAAKAHPAAIGFVGRIESPSEPVVGRPRAIGQVRATGYVDVNFNSINEDAVYAPLTPMGANMAFRRQRMNRLFGKAWFDAGLTGSAIREETTLSLAIHRAGEHLVFVPGAALTHFEARRGGCNNRGTRTLGERVEHRALETVFLARLYQSAGLLHAASALRMAFVGVARARGPRDKLSTSAVHLAGFFRGRRRYRALSRDEARALSLVPAISSDEEQAEFRSLTGRDRRAQGPGSTT